MIIVLAAWMLDPVACAGMEIAAATPLIDLHRLLIEKLPMAPPRIPRQLNIAFDSIRLRGMKSSERSAIACLANLLVQAAGVVTGGARR